MNRVLLEDLGISVVDSDYTEVLESLARELPGYRGKFAVFFEGNLLSHVLKNGKVRECLHSADFVFPDGVAVAKRTSWSKGGPVGRISGPTFLLKACEFGVSRSWRHFFYGGTPESLEVLTQKLRSAYPGLEIAGAYAPPFRPLTGDEEKEVQAMIDAARPDFLWVGLGGPKQEFWISEHRDKLAVPLMLGVGAAFDFHSGNRPWAPKLIRRIGLEWLWRAFSGGRKTFWCNLRCVTASACYLLRIRLFCRKTRQ